MKIKIIEETARQKTPVIDTAKQVQNQLESLHQQEQLINQNFASNCEEIIVLLEKSPNSDLNIFFDNIRNIHTCAKGCAFFSAHACNEILLRLHLILKPLALKSLNKTEIAFQVSVDVLTDILHNNLTGLKNNPKDTIEAMAQEIANQSLACQKNEKWKNYLRQTIIRFIESSLNKILWDKTNPEQIRLDFFKTANLIVQLCDIGVVAHEDELNDLLHTLISRFIYFLDLCGNELPLYFYEDFIGSVIDGEACFFLKFQDASLPQQQQTKSRLSNALQFWYSKLQAQHISQAGIVKSEANLAN